MIRPQVEARSLEILLEEHELPVVLFHVLCKEPGQTLAWVRAVVDFLTERLRVEQVFGE